MVYEHEIQASMNYRKFKSDIVKNSILSILVSLMYMIDFIFLSPIYHTIPQKRINYEINEEFQFVATFQYFPIISSKFCISTLIFKHLTEIKWEEKW